MTGIQATRGKRVLISGAARGIGAALAEKLAAGGSRLALVGLEAQRLAAVAARCGEGTFVHECDVSDSSQVSAAVTEANRMTSSHASSSSRASARRSSISLLSRRRSARSTGPSWFQVSGSAARTPFSTPASTAVSGLRSSCAASATKRR